MNIRRRRKGVILLQTLVMSVIISLMAVMMLKWVLGRYMLAARAFRSAKSASHSEGYSGSLTSSWAPPLTVIPANGNASVDAQNINFVVTPIANGTNRVDFTSNEEDITN